MTQQPAKRRNAVAVIAAVTGVVLLAGGSTYALWSASAGVAGGTITAGNLDLVAIESNAWDVSSDRTDGTDTVTTEASTDPEIEAVELTAAPKGHAIDDLGTWRMVPGDTVALTFPYQITLLGDNLVASLTMPGLDTLLDESSFTDGAPSGLTLEYQLFSDDGTALTARAALTSTDDFTASYFRASRVGQDDGVDTGSIPVIDAGQDNDNSAVVVYVLYVTFDSKSADQGQKDTGAALTLSENVKATLEQVRCGTAGAPFAVCG